jgi:hypothetical protein
MLISFLFHSARREMCILVRALFAIFALGTYGVAHFYDYRGDCSFAEIWPRSLAFFYFEFRKKEQLRGLLSCVVVQLCRQLDSYCDILSMIFLEHENEFQHPNDKAP